MNYLRGADLVNRGFPAEVGVIRGALTFAAVVAYCRPFTKGKRKNSRSSKPRIPGEIVRKLSPESKGFHERLMKDRNQAWAHTDYAAREPETIHQHPELGPVVVMRNAWAPLSEVEVETFRNLLNEINLCLE